MMNLLEIMQAAQGGNAVNNLARQFGISTEQAQSAVEALLPAFSMGLQRQAESMEGFSSLLGSLSQAGQSAEFFDSDGDGIPDHLEDQGGNALGAMFGGEAVQQAVANQAAQFAGLSSGIMQQMLPVIASMVMGGLFKGATNNGLGGLLQQMMQGGGAGGGLGSVLGNMMGQGGMGMAPQAPAGNPMGGILGGILGGLMGGAAQQPAPQPQGGLGGLLGGLFGGAQPQPPSYGQQQASDPMMAGLDALRGMFQAGQQAQSQQMDAFGSIFEQFTKGMRR